MATSVLGNYASCKIENFGIWLQASNAVVGNRPELFMKFAVSSVYLRLL